jgi:hypothetical protein
MFTDENWCEQPLYTLPADHVETCPEHGEWNPHGYYDEREISEMIADDALDCPLCLAEIVGIGGLYA